MIQDSSAPQGAAALDKGLSLFSRVVRDGGETPLTAIANELAVPLSSARRLLAAFERQGLVTRVGHGRYAAGVALAALGRLAAPRATLVRAVRPSMHALACRYASTAHLGILEEDMVTYVAKAQGGRTQLFTREADQLEAYGSGLGKVLLAHLGADRLNAYLDAGGFIALTPRTLVDPAHLREELALTLARDYAVDNGEVADDVYCIAVPVRDPAGGVIAALSISGRPERLREAPIASVLQDLRVCALRVGAVAAHDPTLLMS